MNSAVYVDQARGWAKALEDREAARTGQKLPDARKAVSRRVAVPPGTLQNLRKNRLKAVAVHWYERLRQGVIAELEAELRHVRHDLQIARQTGLDPSSREAHALLASEARIREALGLSDPASGEGGEQ